MKTKIFIVTCFFIFSSFCFADDAEEIYSILQENFEACNREDADALLNTCSKDMPNRDEFKRESIKLWREKDIHYSLIDVNIVRIKGNYAVAQVVQKTLSTDRNYKNEREKFYRNGTTLLPEAETVRYMAAFKKDFGKWKCYLTISQPVPIK